MSTLSALYGMVHSTFSNLFISLPVPEAHSDMSKQIYIVTGSNVGLGFELSRHLLRLGVGRLIMGVRNQAKGETARQRLLDSTGRRPDAVEVWPLDMEDYTSVKTFAHRVNTDLPRIDGICANAGVWPLEFHLSGSEDIELTLNVNVVSQFLLFFLLLPKMREHEQVTGSRTHFVIPNSALHYVASHKELQPTHDILTRLNDPQTADMGGRYPLSKLLVVWIVRELSAAAPATPLPIINTPNPNWCQSDLLRENKSAAARVAARLFARTTEMGSRALYHGLVAAGTESHGKFLTNCHVQAPARHVTSKAGLKIQKQIFKELLQQLETIEPGVTLGLAIPMKKDDLET